LRAIEPSGAGNGMIRSGGVVGPRPQVTGVL
jgi:hypothetical protein